MWTKSETGITIITTNSNTKIGKYFLFGVSSLVFTLCGVFAGIIYAKYGVLNVGMPFFVFIGMGTLMLYAGFYQKNLNPRQYAFVDTSQEKIGFAKLKTGPFYELCFSEFKCIRLVQESYFSNNMNSSLNSNTVIRQEFQIYLVQKNESVFWIDTFISAEQATEYALTLYGFIQLPIENLINDTAFDLTAKTYTKLPDKEQTHQGPIGIKQNVLTYKRTSSNTEKFGTFLLFLVVGFIPLALIKDNSGTSDYLISGFFCFIALFFYVALLISKRKYFIHISNQRITLNIQYRPVGKKVNIKVDIPKSKLTAIQVNRLENGNYLFALRAKNLNLNVANALQGYLKEKRLTKMKVS